MKSLCLLFYLVEEYSPWYSWSTPSTFPSTLLRTKLKKPSILYLQDEQELAYVETAETESGNEDPDSSKIDMTPIYLEEEHLEDNDQKIFQRKRQRATYSYSDQTVQSYMEGEVLEKEFNAIGANVACKLQRMSLQQRYHAELLINKVLIKGLKESLTEATDLTSNWQNQLEGTKSTMYTTCTLHNSILERLLLNPGESYPH